MKKIYYILSALFLCVVATSAQEAGKTVVIKTNVGTMKAILYDDVPNHTRTFIERAKRGDFNGTLFTRVLPEFMCRRICRMHIMAEQGSWGGALVMNMPTISRNISQSSVICRMNSVK